MGMHLSFVSFYYYSNGHIIKKYGHKIYFNRKRDRKTAYPELERILTDRIQSRIRYGLYRTPESIQVLAKDIAAELGIEGFVASRHWLYSFIRRSNFKFGAQTTDKQQCVWSFLACWHKWIKEVRQLALTMGIVSQKHYISSYHVWNADEFAIQAHDKRMLQVANKNAQMINTQHIKMTPSAYKRFCTVTAIIPKSGFAPIGKKKC